jgi:protein TonB
LLAQEPNPDEPVDLTGEGFVTGNADRFAGGITAKSGTSKQAVRSAAATPTGVPGGTGTAPAPVVPAEDKSRPAAPDPSVSWKDCGFTPEADIEGINEARVGLAVTVGPDGRAKSVSVVKDPGYGFGALARNCAFRKSFQVGLDTAGTPVTKTAVFTVKFTR